MDDNAPFMLPSALSISPLLTSLCAPDATSMQMVLMSSSYICSAMASELSFVALAAVASSSGVCLTSLMMIVCHPSGVYVCPVSSISSRY